MNTGMKENRMTELNLKEIKNVCGGGVITGFFDPYSVLSRKPKKDQTGSERKDH